MKRQIFLILTFLCLSGSCSVAFAQSDKPQRPKTEKESVTFMHRTKTTNRPNMPARYSILCRYSIGHLSFELPPNVDAVNIILGDEMFPVWVGFVNKVNPEVEIPELHGEVQIVCITDSGSKFKGVLQF